MSQEATFTRAYRADALTAQRGRCAYCHSRLTAQEATADHMLARKNGGRTKRDNIVAACKDCNLAKGHLSVAEFTKKIKYPNGDPWKIYHAWVRRKLSVRIDRAEKRILRSVGLIVGTK